jgi:hypothetical protein
LVDQKLGSLIGVGTPRRSTHLTPKAASNGTPIARRFRVCSLSIEEDAAIYFGRDDDIRRLIERLDARRAQGGARLVATLSPQLDTPSSRTESCSRPICW